jgi:hypothetical protein
VADQEMRDEFFDLAGSKILIKLLREENEHLRAEVERLQNELAHWMNHWRTKL